MQGIMFNLPTGMLSQVIKGRKVMTRRLRGLEEVNKNPGAWTFSHDRGDDAFCFKNETDHVLNPVVCKPRYNVGETVFVKESHIEYIDKHIEYKVDFIGRPEIKAKWSNAMFCGEKAARHFLKITNVRVERLQDISEEDCLKEGVEGTDDFYTPITNFSLLIDVINGKHTWMKNPWVFIYSFELTKPQ